MTKTVAEKERSDRLFRRGLLIIELVKALEETTDCLRDVAEGKGGWAWETVLDYNLDLLAKAKAKANL